MTILDTTAWAFALLALVPLAVLAIEWLVALFPAGRSAPAGNRPACAVLIPAHDEEAGLPATLASVRRQLREGDRILVVADNCTDATANVARFASCEVVERHDLSRRGKGYALDAGVRALAADPPTIVVVMDADCLLDNGALDRLVGVAACAGRPAQAAYLMRAPAGAGAGRRVAAFAFLVKNLVRPLGLHRLGLPCLLTGTGMAFPWPVLRDARLASGELVEDMQLAVDLAIAGRPPVFVPDARVLGEFPIVDAAAASQRRRWEHGHLGTLSRGVPRLAFAGLRRPALLALAAETGVPPLSLVVLTVAAVLLLTASAWLAGGSAWPLAATSVGFALWAGLLTLVWLRFGRDELPARSLLAVPAYALGKLPVYAAWLVRPQRAWVRTGRDPAPEVHPLP